MIEFDERLIDKVAKELAAMPEKVTPVLSQAINRAMTSGRAKAATKARETYSVKAGLLKQGIVIRRANRNNLYASARFKGSPVPLAEFGAKPQGRTKAGKRRFLRVLAKEKRQVEMQHAFMINSGGKNLVGEHPAGSPQRIHWLYGPSVPQMMGEQRVIDEFERRAKEVLVERVEHGIEHALEGGFGGIR